MTKTSTFLQHHHGADTCTSWYPARIEFSLHYISFIIILKAYCILFYIKLYYFDSCVYMRGMATQRTTLTILCITVQVSNMISNSLFIKFNLNRRVKYWICVSTCGRQKHIMLSLAVDRFSVNTSLGLIHSRASSWS